MAVEIPDLLIANVRTLTTQFVVVLGNYNFAIARSSGFPVVGFPDGCWHEEHKVFYPFSTARRMAFLISRTLQTPRATTELPLPEELRRYAG